MTVAVTAFMPIAIPVALAPIFPRVTMLSAIVFAGGFAPTRVLIAADGLAALFADYVPIVLPILGIAIILPILGTDFIAVVLPILGASGLMLVTALFAGCVLSLMLLAAFIMTRLLLMTRLGMRII